jgi:hypothetical protein
LYTVRNKRIQCPNRPNLICCILLYFLGSPKTGGTIKDIKADDQPLDFGGASLSVCCSAVEVLFIGLKGV